MDRECVKQIRRWKKLLDEFDLEDEEFMESNIRFEVGNARASVWIGPETWDIFECAVKEMIDFMCQEYELGWVEYQGETYYVSLNTGWVYTFYKLNGFNKQYPNTDMVCCMCVATDWKAITESGCEGYEVEEIIGWEFVTGDHIQKKDFENMIAEYEKEKR